jgi:H+-translocating NAD(P) transhydrogenase subunit alpha
MFLKGETIHCCVLCLIFFNNKKQLLCGRSCCPPLRGVRGGLYMNSILNWITINQQIIYIVILMIFVGIEVIGRVPSVLHTPLMSGANAIHGVVIIGAIIVMGKAEEDNYLALVLGFIAVIVGTLNVVGGFVVTDRMLEMFKKKKK